MRKIITVLLVMALCLGLLAGCCLSHEWQEATCENPKTCAACGQENGVALGHVWRDATCEEPATCTVCGETEGEKLGHSYEADICTLCGKTKDTVTCRESYTGDEKELKNAADAVVATMGHRELTNGMLQIYYSDSVMTYYSQNYYYLPMLGVDTSLPLDESPFFGDAGMTWQHYFLDSSLEAWASYTAVAMMAEADGYTIPQELQEQLDTTASQLDTVAQMYGYEDAQAYLAAAVAPGVSVEDFITYNTMNNTAGAYVQYFYEANQPSAEEIAAYAAENAAALAESGITEDMGLVSAVRHILITPEGGTVDEFGMTTYSDEEWAVALDTAEEVLQQWKAGEATEESFAALVPTFSADGGSVGNGGLYENVCDDGTYVASFTQWAIDPARQAGDTGIVETEYGYHIMYFVAGEDYYSYAVSQTMMAELFQQRLEAVKQENGLDVDYRAVWLAGKSFAG